MKHRKLLRTILLVAFVVVLFILKRQVQRNLQQLYQTNKYWKSRLRKGVAEEQFLSYFMIPKLQFLTPFH